MEMVEVQYGEYVNSDSLASQMPPLVRDSLDVLANGIADKKGLAITRREYMWIPSKSILGDPLAQRAAGGIKFWLATPKADVDAARNKTIAEEGWVSYVLYSAIKCGKTRELNVEMADFDFDGKAVRYIRFQAASFNEENFK